MIDRALDLYHQYYDQFITWYNALDFFTQVVVFAVAGVVALLIITFIHLSRITK
jgi:hypothetical protein